jgi:hypothetical protein
MYIPKIVIITTVIVFIALAITIYGMQNEQINNSEQISQAVDTVAKQVDLRHFASQKIYLIDNSLIFVERSGFASDYSYHHLLLDMSGKELCSLMDSLTGPRKTCQDDSKREMFETIIANLDKPNLGLVNHTAKLVRTKQKE